MKVYCFYLVRREINPLEYKAVTRENIEHHYENDVVLYAFTPSKDSELFFLETRRKDLFFEKVVDMCREDYEEFCETYNDCLFEYHTFNVKKLVNGIYQSQTEMMLCTMAESDSIIFYKEDCVMSIISDILDDGYLEVMEKVKFKPKLKKILDEMFLYEDLVCKISPIEDINYDMFTVDDLSLYIKLYSNTFKKRWLK